MIRQNQISSSLEKIIKSNDSLETKLNNLVLVIGEGLNCDRCFLYVRNPETKKGKVASCWRKSKNYPEIQDRGWKQEDPSLVREDPMFAAAVKTKPSIFVEDVNTADSQVLNQDFEQREFGHRALIHAHICPDNLLWGILQPCVFEHPRNWSQDDRLLIKKIVPQVAPLVKEYVTKYTRKL